VISTEPTAGRGALKAPFSPIGSQGRAIQLTAEEASSSHNDIIGSFEFRSRGDANIARSVLDWFFFSR
jgi:hypothetical protein